MLTVADIDDLIHLRIPEAQAREILQSLTPDQITPELYARLLERMALTVVPLPALDVSLMDCCGTGGSGLPHFNTSTSVAFVLAAGGVNVVKFGNRAMTSKSGSFDFLEGLGIPPELELARIPDYLEQTGLVFLFAPQCYPALGQFNGLRRSLKVRSVFNFMGPLLHPFQPEHRLLGVSDPLMQAVMAGYLADHPAVKKALVVRGQDNLDELSHDAPSILLHVDETGISQTTYTPGALLEDAYTPLEHTPSQNLKLFQAMLDGDDASSRYYRMVCLNAGAGFFTAGRTSSIEDGTALAADLFASGKVKALVETCRRVYGQ